MRSLFLSKRTTLDLVGSVHYNLYNFVAYFGVIKELILVVIQTCMGTWKYNVPRADIECIYHRTGKSGKSSTILHKLIIGKDT